MGWYTRIPLGTRLVVAFTAGAAVGLALGPGAAGLAPAARLLTDLLRLLAPLVVAAFVLSALSHGGLRAIGATAARMVAGCVLLAALAAAIGAIAVAGLRPVGPLAAGNALVAPPSWSSALAAWLPARGVGLEKTVPLVFVLVVPAALALGAWRAARPGGPAAALHRGLRRLERVVTRAMAVVLEYAPIGAFASAAVMFGEAGGGAGAPLAGAVLGVYAAHAVLALALFAAAAGIGLWPRRLLRESRDTLVTAIATGSSAATLPLELRAAEGPLGVPSVIARTVMPLGTTFSKIGTTAFLGALGVTGGLLAGLELTWPWIAGVILWSTVAGVVTPPVSGGGFVMLALVFGQTGVPLAWVPVLTSLPFIGKLNTPLNALGRLLIAWALAQAESGRGRTPHRLVRREAETGAQPGSGCSRTLPERSG